MSETFAFKAEIKQLLDILVHSLYTEREIFLRELISNASDALNRMQFEQLTNQNVVDPDAELKIHLTTDEESGTLTISDTGIGMTQAEMEENLGVIAHSGAKAFIEAMKEAKNGASAQDVIGQFGVGFYSVFMVADRVRVVSRSYDPVAASFAWESSGDETYTLEEADREGRGTDIIITLKDDAKEFLQEWQLKDIIRRHSDYIAFPIYVGDDEAPTNKQAAIWRQQANEISDEQYDDFYKMLTMDFEGPLHRIHVRADVPLQFYALLYTPNSAEPSMFSPRKEPGLKLYARKVLIEEYSTDLLPEYLQFIGVVDSEDLPLSVSRENVQATRVMVNLKKTLTSRILNDYKRMAKNDTEKFLGILQQFGRFFKQGLVVSPEDKEDLESLLFFNSTHDDDPDSWYSLNDYVGRMAENQEDIYYIIGDDLHSARRSPHLDAFRQRGIEVLYFTDPINSFMVVGLNEYDGHTLRNVDEADIDLSEIGEAQAEDEATPQHEPLQEGEFDAVRARFKAVLGERVQDVRQSKTLTGSPARLVSDDSGTQRNMFRINRLLDKEFELPVKTLELNPRHPLVHNLSQMIDHEPDSMMVDVVIEQLFETALLQDGIHPDPAAMADRLLVLMEAATGTPQTDLDLASVAPEIVPEAPEETPDETDAAEEVENEAEEEASPE